MEQTQAQTDAPLLTLLPLLYKQLLSLMNPREQGLTKSRSLALLSLASNGTLHMSQIAKYISSTKEQTTRVVATLVDEGYVVRTQDISNRTKIYIQLTDKGLSLVEKWRTELTAQMYARLCESLTENEQAELQSATYTLIRLLKKVD